MKRVNFLCLVLLGLFFTACHSNDDTWGDWSRSSSGSEDLLEQEQLLLLLMMLYMLDWDLISCWISRIRL